jgi:hypothetical protein
VEIPRKRERVKEKEHRGIQADHWCDTPGVYFGLCRKNYPNLGCSVKISISRSHMSLIIQTNHSQFTEFEVNRSREIAKFGAY